MWWERPRHDGYHPVFRDSRLLEIVARAFAVVEVGGLSGQGPERGRRFERVFYDLCERRGIRLSERAGARTLGGQGAASGFGHEVDGATRSVTATSYWELKHLTSSVPKNELLIFNGKALDFLFGSHQSAAQAPIFRFLLSGGDVRDECRQFAVLWGIMVVEPSRLPLPLICEAVARGGYVSLSSAEVDAVRYRAAWGCRPLQEVLVGLSGWIQGQAGPQRFYGPRSGTVAREILDIQEQLGATLLDWLDEVFPDWIDETAEATWKMVGGW